MGCTRGSMNKAEEADTENLYGIMAKPTKGIGDWGKNMAMEFGDLQRGTTTKGSGRRICKMGKDATFTKAARCTEAISKIP